MEVSILTSAERNFDFDLLYCHFHTDCFISGPLARQSSVEVNYEYSPKDVLSFIVPRPSLVQ